MPNLRRAQERHFATALREGDGVGEDLADVGKLDPRGSNDVVPDAEEGFAGDDQIVREQQVKVLGDRPVEAVFDGQDAELDGAGLDGFAGLCGEGAGHDFEREPRVLHGHGVQGGNMRVGTELALNRDLRCSFWC